MSDDQATDRPGPAHEVHRELGAKFASFAGWSMPLSYAGTVSEHKATREAAGLFDVSHLGKAVVRGPGAADFVNRSLTNDLGRIAPGKAQYTLYCNDSGGVIDDLIAYLVSDEEVFLVPNAANTAAVVEDLRAAAPAGVEIENQHDDYGVIAVQGPRSADVLAAVGLPTELDYMAFVDADGPAGPVRVCRTGYTGERGFEIVAPAAATADLIRALLAPLSEVGGAPAGLGARDTLRTEMGYPLHGHELSPTITPVEARCGWAVGWRKPEFRGHEVLREQKKDGAPRTLVGLAATGRGVLRADAPVLLDGAVVGTTTSGTFSPSLSIGIALALVDRAAALPIGADVEVEIRGRAVPARVAELPFVPAHTR
ncbi:glycine cleavage system aminomethyltransferase GcvT [Millisia brevis]|uniref:glycine cleavage system aminomethyltransferase GcvT n=1 Tax=Millisia brevis TaxID=264148 RepID=UPI00082D63B3|nr:glycine cleavage system aminomethyltransferase GcvT [Millisia brevis]